MTNEGGQSLYDRPRFWDESKESGGGDQRRVPVLHGWRAPAHQFRRQNPEWWAGGQKLALSHLRSLARSVSQSGGHLEHNPFVRRRLTSSGWLSSFPVISRYGVSRPGQIRDKIWAGDPSFGGLAILILSGIAGAAVIGPGLSATDSAVSKRSDAERKRLHDETVAAVDRIAAEAHAKLPRSIAQAVGAIYARFSTLFQDSAVDQIRELYEFAVTQVHYEGFPPEVLRAQSEDMALMFGWFDRTGYAADVKSLRRDFPEVKWHTFEQWARQQDWRVLDQGQIG